MPLQDLRSDILLPDFLSDSYILYKKTGFHDRLLFLQETGSDLPLCSYSQMPLPASSESHLQLLSAVLNARFYRHQSLGTGRVGCDAGNVQVLSANRALDRKSVV